MLARAYAYHSKALVKVLLDSGADFSAVCKRGRTPLHIAVLSMGVWGYGYHEGAGVAPARELEDAAVLLVERGADPSHPDADGWTPLQHCKTKRWIGFEAELRRAEARRGAVPGKS